MSWPDREAGFLATTAKEAVISKVRVSGFSMSLDGFGAGPAQDLDNPLGQRGMELHRSLVDTRTFRQATGQEGGSSGVNDAHYPATAKTVGVNVLDWIATAFPLAGSHVAAVVGWITGEDRPGGAGRRAVHRRGRQPRQHRPGRQQ